MPYRIAKRNGKRPWKLIDSDTGRVVATSTSRSRVQAARRARYAAEGGHVHTHGSGGSFARAVRRAVRRRRT